MNINLEGTRVSTVRFVKLCAVNLLDLTYRHNVSQCEIKSSLDSVYCLLLGAFSQIESFFSSAYLKSSIAQSLNMFLKIWLQPYTVLK